MPPHLERIDWMPSPPLAPDDGPIDIDHLRRMTLGDTRLEREVLAMFAAQSVSLIATLVTLPAADAAQSLEAAIRDGGEPTEALAELHEAIAQARMAVDAILRRS
jgi:hypothetical protein